MSEEMVVCYLPVNQGLQIEKQAWGLICQAKKLSGTSRKLIGIVVHAGLKNEEIKTLPFDEVYHIKLSKEGWYLADNHIKIFRQLFHSIRRKNGIYLFSSTPLYQEIAVRLSAMNNASVITNVSEILKQEENTSELMLKREIYFGKALEHLKFNDVDHKFITMDKANLYGEVNKANPFFVKEIEFRETEDPHIRFISTTVIDWKELSVTDAKCVIGIGRGVDQSESINEVLKLAEILQAPIGGTKVADELGLIPRERRIGASGHKIDADIYIAIGISGSAQHIEGIKDVKHIIAINIDPAAPIFQKCTIGIIGDFESVVPQLVQAIQGEKEREYAYENLRTS